MFHHEARGVGDHIDLIGRIIRRLRHVNFTLDILCRFGYPSVRVETVNLGNIVVCDRLLITMMTNKLLKSSTKLTGDHEKNVILKFL